MSPRMAAVIRAFLTPMNGGYSIYGRVKRQETGPRTSFTEESDTRAPQSDTCVKLHFTYPTMYLVHIMRG